MRFAVVLGEVRSALEQRGMRFVLVGGVAVAAHGVPRFTFDLDFLVASADADGAVRAVEELGFETARRLPGFSNHFRNAKSERVDLLYTDAATFDKLHARAVRRPLFDQAPIPVVHPEHLVAMKLFALSQNRSRVAIDLEDVRSLLRMGLVDEAAVSGYLERYGLGEFRATLGIPG